MIEHLENIDIQKVKGKERVEWLGEGQWLHEPDFVQFTEELSGYPCLINRGEVHGGLNGYVGVPKGTFFYEANYDLVPYEVSVHGGLTYSDHVNKGLSFIHPTDYFKDYWLFGFDTGHAGDYNPALEKKLSSLGSKLSTPYRQSAKYKDIRYVRSQTINLAKQLYKLSIQRGHFSWT